MSLSEDDVSDLGLDEDFDDFELPPQEEEDEEGAVVESDTEEEADPEESKEPEILADYGSDTRRIIVVPDEDRITSNVMTRAELANAIAVRAQQISAYPYDYVEHTGAGEPLTSAAAIASAELYSRRSPLILRRRVGRTEAGETIIEKWCVREMTYPPMV